MSGDRPTARSTEHRVYIYMYMYMYVYMHMYIALQVHVQIKHYIWCVHERSAIKTRQSRANAPEDMYMYITECIPN